MERDNSDLLMLYQVTSDRIAEFKSQQWSIINYAVLLYVALVSTKTLIPEVGRFEEILLAGMVLFVLGVGVYLVRQFSSSIKERQRTLSAVREELGETFMDCWRGRLSSEKLPNDIDRIKPKTNLKFFHMFVLFAGSLIANWLIFRI